MPTCRQEIPLASYRPAILNEIYPAARHQDSESACEEIGDCSAMAAGPKLVPQEPKGLFSRAKKLPSVRNSPDLAAPIRWVDYASPVSFPPQSLSEQIYTARCSRIHPHATIATETSLNRQSTVSRDSLQGPQKIQRSFDAGRRGAAPCPSPQKRTPRHRKGPLATEKDPSPQKRTPRHRKGVAGSPDGLVGILQCVVAPIGKHLVFSLLS